jgi:tRNA threonylcarbamoyladenosine biosynthesis protein TsaB
MPGLDYHRMNCVLALETATTACSAAIWRNGEVHQEYSVVPRRHNAEILGMVDRVTAAAGIGRADLEGIAVGIGPGSFTGLRIAAGVAQGIAYGLNLPAVPVSTLRAVAARAGRELGVRRVLAVLDARRNEVYWAAYEDAVAVTGEHASSISDITLPGPGGWTACGSGLGDLNGLPEPLRTRLDSVEPTIVPAAWDVAVLGAAALARGEGRPPHQLEPVYLSAGGGWKTAHRDSDG